MASILIVEDEALIARDLQQSLRAMGHEVPAPAGTAEDALRAAEKSAPDLVLMDIHLRGSLDGIAAAGRLREKFDPALIFLTAYADDETVKRARETQPEGYLLKPFNEDELRSTIEIALHKHATSRKLRESERWFKAALGAIGDAVLTMDASRRVTFMNSAAACLTGYSPQDALGRSVDDVFAIEHTDVREAQPEFQGEPGVPRPGEIAHHRSILRTRDGGSIPIEDTISPIPGDGHEVLGAVVVFRDMRSERALQERLALADRLAALGTLATGVAHEINNPLSYIASNAAYVLEVLSNLKPERTLTEQQVKDLKEALCDAADGVVRVRTIVDDLSTFVRGGPQNLTDCEIHEPLDAALKMAAPEIAPHAHLTRAFATGLPKVLAPKPRLAQVFLNLIVNALQAMPTEGRKGELRVETRLASGGKVEVLVSDNGAGMEPEVLRRIFEPFYTTRPVGSGRGLGLSICHGIVTGLGGELSATSTPGIGTVFRVLLPAALPDERGLPRLKARGSVLLVGDERLFPATLLGSLGEQHELTLAASARDVVGRLGLGERFDAIVCELEAPGFPGERLYGEVGALDPAQARRIVFVYGASALPSSSSFLQRVGNPRLEVPVLVDELGDQIRKLASAASREFR